MVRATDSISAAEKFRLTGPPGLDCVWLDEAPVAGEFAGWFAGEFADEFTGELTDF